MDNDTGKLSGSQLHAAEQASAASAQLAELVAAYYQELISRNVPDELAWQLTILYQTNLLGGRQ